MKITLEEVIYEVPEQWLDITIGQLQEIVSIDPLLEEIDKTVYIVSILSGIDVERLYSLPFSEYKKLVEVLSFMKDEIPNELLQNIIIDGIEYKFYCDLEMSTAQYIDMDSMCKSNDPSNLHMLMAICYRENERYDSKEVRKRAEIFKNNMSVNYAIGAQVFMEILDQTSSKIIQDYSAMTNQQ